MRDRVSKYLSRKLIIEGAKKKWNARSKDERERCGGKYHHIFRHPMTWDEEFSNLNFSQKSILIKGELIRVYDSLPNIAKTEIKNELPLSVFSSKWFKLPPCDKKKLLIHVLGK